MQIMRLNGNYFRSTTNIGYSTSSINIRKSNIYFRREIHIDQMRSTDRLLVTLYDAYCSDGMHTALRPNASDIKQNLRLACTRTAGGMKTVINSNEAASICHDNCKFCKPRQVLLVSVVFLVIAIVVIVVEDDKYAGDVDIDFLYNNGAVVVVGKYNGAEVRITVDRNVDANVGAAVIGSPSDYHEIELQDNILSILRVTFEEQK
uniref:Uncharacterized protein n=1 Tax=Glossina brevipalpis TaxID=37001 RepID=A0A1A9X423_9MUSC